MHSYTSKTHRRWWRWQKRKPCSQCRRRWCLNQLRRLPVQSRRNQRQIEVDQRRDVDGETQLFETGNGHVITAAVVRRRDVYVADGADHQNDHRRDSRRSR